MKKLISLFLALLMVFSLAAATLAVEGEGEGEEETRPTAGDSTTVRGTITINKVLLDDDNKPAATYAIYQMLKLNSYDTTAGSYYYTYADGWEAFFAGEGAAYIGVNESGSLVWVGSDSDTRIAEFAQKALTYAEDNHISPIKTTDTPEGQTPDYKLDDTSIVFEDLELGYYLIDSTVGALCGLSTTNPDGVIDTKNEIHTTEKTVLEDSTGKYVTENTADIGQIMDFMITINVKKGAENFVLTDTMTDGLTFVGLTKIEHIIPGSGIHEMKNEEGKPEKYVLETDVEAGSGHIHQFKITFSEEEVCKKLNPNDKIIIYYQAMVTRDAVIAGDGNTNSAQLEFGDNHESNISTTTTKTYSIDIVKTDGSDNLLDGAQFRIYDHESGGNEVAVVIKEAVKYDEATHGEPLVYYTMVDGVKVEHELKFDCDNDGVEDLVGQIISYRRARTDETGVDIIVQNGLVKVLGLDNGTYYLQETIAPDGYNPLASRKQFIIADGNWDSNFTNGIYSTGSGVHVINNTGSRLPETGGLGTLLFTLLGGSTALGTGVVLVTKKRMSMIEE